MKTKYNRNETLESPWVCSWFLFLKYTIITRLQLEVARSIKHIHKFVDIRGHCWVVFSCYISNNSVSVRYLNTSTDPCAVNACRKPYSTCRAERDKAICSCNINCPRIIDPVCGSDYKTYDNQCLMHLFSCQTGVVIRVRLRERCVGTKFAYFRFIVFYWFLFGVRDV